MLPTRLVHVALDESLPAKLVESVNLDPTTTYLTLSHCWGDHLPMKLSKSNLNSLKQSINTEDLPPTFKDALAVTRSLGMKYMWIDALCIIQDSPEDWQKESAQMCHIYENSFCTISATVSRSSFEGIFRERNSLVVQSIPLKIGGKMRNIVQRDAWEHKVENSPLNKRAWVLQEKILSPRNLHFTNQIFWQCSTMVCSESFPQGIPRSTDSEDGFFKEIVTQAFQEKNEPPRDVQAETHNLDAWSVLVQKYSSANHNILNNMI